ncbi:MAG: hypothetical protein ACRDVP_03970 [Acidimicrobiales bacterium]
MGQPDRVVVFVVGILIVASTSMSVFTTLVVPRATSARLLRQVSRSLARAVSPMLRRVGTYDAKDRIVGLVGPLGIIVLFATWIVSLILGFAAMIWWATGTSFVSSLGFSASSVVTLGILSGKGASKPIEIIEAAFGFLVIALEIAYLPTLYASFSARESEVTMLAARAGVPAWGPEVLARHFRFQYIDELPALYGTWERWAAGVSESHAGYPSLIWFRSPDPSRSWLLALVAILDAAAMHQSVAPGSAPPQARLCLRMGINCLRSLADALRIGYDADPRPDQPIRLGREEFFEGFDLLESVRFPIERTREEAWKHFAGWRVNYEPIVDALTMIVLPPPAPWLLARPELGIAKFPRILNRTPDDPDAGLWRPLNQL